MGKIEVLRIAILYVHILVVLAFSPFRYIGQTLRKGDYMSSKASSVDARRSNNMFLKQTYKEKEAANTQRYVRMGTIACIALAITAYLGRGFITERPACVKWNFVMNELEEHTGKIRRICEKSEKEYWLSELLQQNENNLKKKMSEKPLLCSRVKKA